MQPNPFFGVILHAIGGLAAASFYLPYKRVRQWSWETYWIVGGIFSWLIAPIIGALVIVAIYNGVPLGEVFKTSPTGAIIGAFGFGALWGVGGLTFGLSMRYLGIALGYAIALGFCAAFGTLVPPVFEGTFGDLLQRTPGRVVLGGVLACLLGIAFSGAAGMSKEKEMTDEQKRAAVAEFNFPKGLFIATLCGLLSACMAFALSAGNPIVKRAVAMGTPQIWAGLPLLIVILLGGLATNAVWCIVLLLMNKSFPEFLGHGKTAGISSATLATNYTFSAIAGVTWYFQFFFYTMGSSQMGPRYSFSSWTLHMSSIIVFSTVWGMLLKEWSGSSIRTHILIGIGLLTLIASTIVVGYGNYLGSK
jgi:L-rhamnose-H+ transport protein